MFNPTNNGVCKLLNDIDWLYIRESYLLNGVKVIDASGCKDLRRINLEGSGDCTFIAPSVTNGFGRLSLIQCNVVGLSKVMFRHEIGDIEKFSLELKSCTGLDTLSVEATGYSGYDDRNAIRIEDKTLRVLAVNAPTLRLSAKTFRLTTPCLRSLEVEAGALKVSELLAMLLDMPEVENISLKVSKIDVSKEERGNIWLNFDAFKRLKRLHIEVAEPCNGGLRLVLPEGCSVTARGVMCSVYKKVGEISG